MGGAASRGVGYRRHAFDYVQVAALVQTCFFFGGAKDETAIATEVDDATTATDPADDRGSSEEEAANIAFKHLKTKLDVPTDAAADVVHYDCDNFVQAIVSSASLYYEETEAGLPP